MPLLNDYTITQYSVTISIVIQENSIQQQQQPSISFLIKLGYVRDETTRARYKTKAKNKKKKIDKKLNKKKEKITKR
jgi:hypothetical protein